MTPHDPSQTRPLPPTCSYLTLRVPNVDACANFYAVLGLPVSPERHGDGPLHYSFPLTPSLVCELYPLREGGVPGGGSVRIGLAVHDLGAIRSALAASGFDITHERSTSFVVCDPAGNQVEITLKGGQ